MMRAVRVMHYLFIVARTGKCSNERVSDKQPAGIESSSYARVRQCHWLPVTWGFTLHFSLAFKFKFNQLITACSTLIVALGHLQKRKLQWPGRIWSINSGAVWVDALLVAFAPAPAITCRKVSTGFISAGAQSVVWVARPITFLS